MRRPGVVVHQVGPLATVDITILDAIRVTSCTRTLIDLAAVVPAETVEEALDDALRRRLTNLPRLGRRIEAMGRKGRPGIAVLRGFIQTRAESGTIPESVIETKLLRLLRRTSSPQPECQFEVRERGRFLARVDFAYPDIRLAIEVDGYRWHSGRARWEHDLRRRNDLTARGWRVIHVTWSDLEARPDDTIRIITEAVGGRPKR
jgi:very-short-patch-repair endonuclease